MCKIFGYPLDSVFVFELWTRLDFVPCLTILRQAVDFWLNDTIFEENKATRTRSTTSGSQLGGGGQLSWTFYGSILGAVFDDFHFNYHCNNGEEL